MLDFSAASLDNRDIVDKRGIEFYCDIDAREPLRPDRLRMSGGFPKVAIRFLHSLGR